MKKIILLSAIIFSTLLAFAQDIDFYLKGKNDNFSLPKIPEEMTFNEFYLLSQTFRMQDMIFATVVPGYIHFKAQENKTGYALVGARAIALSALTYEYFKLKQQTSSLTLTQFLVYGGQNQILTKTDRIVISMALTTALTSYIFDIIHGKYILEKKQEKIRYKYSPRISFYSSFIDNYYGMGLSLSF